MSLSRLSVFFSVASALCACNTAWGETPVPAAEKNFSVGGYSSAGIHIHPGGEAEAMVNEFALIFNWDAGGRLRLFAEMEVEEPLTWEEGSKPNTGDAYFDVERLYADYSLTGQINVRAGRFLTPVGRWNLLHAAPLVWTSLRPASTERLFPMAVNGVMLHGTLPWGNAAIEYAGYVEAVRDQRDDPGEIPFENTRGLRVAYAGAAEVGASLLAFDEDDNGSSRYRMLGLDFFKAWDGWEVSGEIYRGFERGDARDTGGGYVQGVAPLGNRWFAISRLENLRTPERSTTGRWLLGAAWRHTSDRVLKLEYVGGSDEHPDMPRGFVASYAILF
jgi:hypothetical protein